MTELEILPAHSCSITFPKRSRETIAVCRCGAVGRPEVLDWIGDRCGECHAHGSDSASADVESLTPIRVSGSVAAASFSASGRILCTVSVKRQEATVAFWEWPERRQMMSYSSRLYLPPGLVPFASNGYEAALDTPKEYLVWDTETGRVLHHQTPGNQFRSLAISIDNRFHAGIADKALHVVERTFVPARSTIMERDAFLEAHPLAFSPDGESLAVGAAQCWVCLVTPETGAVDRVLHNQPKLARMGLGSAYVRSLAFSPDGSLIVAGCGALLDEPDDQADAGTVLLWACDEELPLACLTGHRGSVNAVTFTPDGEMIVSAGADGTVRIWDVLRATELAALGGHKGPVLSLSFSVDGEWLVSGGADGEVRLWPWRKLLAI